MARVQPLYVSRIGECAEIDSLASLMRLTLRAVKVCGRSRSKTNRPGWWRMALTAATSSDVTGLLDNGASGINGPLIDGADDAPIYKPDRSLCAGCADRPEIVR